MPSSINNLVKELIIFYITENYNTYIKENNITKIPDNEISDVISKMFDSKKDHLRDFLKKTLKDILKDEYIGDLPVNTICNEIYRDEDYCKNRLVLEIKKKQMYSQ